MFKVLINDKCNSNGSVVTIGNFDGLHLGHQQLLQQLNVISKKKNLIRILITFEPSPYEFFLLNSSNSNLGRLSLLRDKFLILKKNNLVDLIIVCNFNKNFSNLLPDDFIQNILINKLNTKHLVIGNNWRFGKNASGTYQDLLKFNIDVSIINKFLINNNVVSSSIIRTAAEQNDFVTIKNYLGRNVHFTSKVVHGFKMGRKYGVPTINFNLDKKKLALWGIYAAYVYIDNIRYNAITSIGQNPTTNNLQTFKLEAHLLDIDLDLYGKIATVEILHFIRNEQKFSNLEVLFKTIHQDIKYGREYFNSLP